ncbi:MAG: hydrogenase expression/formation C-terminal domain-containing protein [Glaciecola sp.]|jgi:hydrogenase-1 operon protein HyaF
MDVGKFIPIKTVVGPGSQTDDFAEGVLEYINMPSEMDTFHQPILPEPEEIGNIDGALELLQVAADMLQTFDHNQGPQQLDLAGLSASSLSLINQFMGVGEVSATLTKHQVASDAPADSITNLDPSRIEIQESVMAGLWRVREINNDNVVTKEYIEVAPIPSSVQTDSFADARPTVLADLQTVPTGVINCPAILTELYERGRDYQKGDAPLVVNLSLLPLSNEDVVLLGERLGVGPTVILSRGYGNCRIGATNCKNVWWIKYYNSEDALILNTIEVIDIPEVAIASPEDIGDSAHRLLEMLEIYQ